MALKLVPPLQRDKDGVVLQPSGPFLHKTVDWGPAYLVVINTGKSSSDAEPEQAVEQPVTPMT